MNEVSVSIYTYVQATSIFKRNNNCYGHSHSHSHTHIHAFTNTLELVLVVTNIVQYTIATCVLECVCLCDFVFCACSLVMCVGVRVCVRSREINNSEAIKSHIDQITFSSINYANDLRECVYACVAFVT